MTDNYINVSNNHINKVNPNSFNDILQRNGANAGFETVLKEQLNKNSPLQFSKHAKERIGQRGIEISETLINDLEQAVSNARDKGARDIVVIDVRGAFIVNVPNNMVITTMSGNEMKDNIFTNIDSAVIIS